MTLVDSYKCIQRLEGLGFKREASESIATSLSELITSSALSLNSHLVQKSEFDKINYISRVDLIHLRSEVSLLEKNEFSVLKSEIARLVSTY